MMTEQKNDDDNETTQDGKDIYLLLRSCTSTKGYHNISKKRGADYDVNE